MLGLGLTDNYLGYIIPAIVAPYNIILVKTYIEAAGHRRRQVGGAVEVHP